MAADSDKIQRCKRAFERLQRDHAADLFITTDAMHYLGEELSKAEELPKTPVFGSKIERLPDGHVAVKRPQWQL